MENYEKELALVHEANQADADIQAMREAGLKPPEEVVDRLLNNLDAFSIVQRGIIRHLESRNFRFSEDSLLASSYDVLATYNKEADTIDTLASRALYGYLGLIEEESPSTSAIESSNAEATPYSVEDMEDTSSAIYPEQPDASLYRRYKEGDLEAQEKLIKQWERLVYKIANRYVDPVTRRFILDREDLIQEGTIGLMKALQNADMDNFNQRSFMSYAAICIHREMGRFIDNSKSTVRVPPHIRDKMRSMEKINMARRHQQRPLLTDEELSKLWEVPIEAPRRGDGSEMNRVSVRAILLAWLMSEFMGSLDNGFQPRRDISPGNSYVADQRQALQKVDSPEPSDTPEEEVQKGSVNETLYRILGTLPDRERRVLELRFGIGEDDPKTLDETGKCFGLTREKIRQLEARALSKLRHSELSS